MWEARRRLAAGEIDYKGFVELVASSAPSTGFCNTMGTATTMNSLAEALGLSLPGSAAIPAPYRDRLECAWRTGQQIVEMVRADRKPSDILTRAAFLNAIRVNSALGGSTNAPIHINAIARHAGVEITLADWERYGHHIPLLVNLQPAGEYLGEDFYRSGGVPAVIGELLRNDHLDGGALTVNGRPSARIATTLARSTSGDPPSTHRSNRMRPDGATRQSVRSAVMKTSVISEEFRPAICPIGKIGCVRRRGRVRRPEDYHARIDDPALGIDERTLLVMRGTDRAVIQAAPGGPHAPRRRHPAGSMRCRASAMGANPVRPARHRSSMLLLRLRPAVDLLCCVPAIACA